MNVPESSSASIVGADGTVVDVEDAAVEASVDGALGGLVAVVEAMLVSACGEVAIDAVAVVDVVGAVDGRASSSPAEQPTPATSSAAATTVRLVEGVDDRRSCVKLFQAVGQSNTVSNSTGSGKVSVVESGSFEQQTHRGVEREGHIRPAFNAYAELRVATDDMIEMLSYVGTMRNRLNQEES